jgi:hypothetical protein
MSKRLRGAEGFHPAGSLRLQDGCFAAGMWYFHVKPKVIK